MFALPGHDIGDVWPYYDRDRDTTHLFFLTAPVDSGKKWSIGHAVSRDLRHWDDLGIALAPGAPGAFDDDRLATGSVIRHDGRYYLAYTGHGRGDRPSTGAVGLAVSDDLCRWERVVSGPVATLDPRCYEAEITGSRPFRHWRDPFLFRDADGFHLLICARRLDGPVKRRGTVAHLTSSDLLNWRTLPPLEVAPWCEEMECPLLYRLDGRFYLLFSTHRDLIDPALSGDGELPGGLFCQVADALTGPYRRAGSGRVPVDVAAGYFYAAQLVVRERDLHLIGTVHRPDGPGYISDPIAVRPGPDGLIVL